MLRATSFAFPLIVLAVLATAACTGSPALPTGASAVATPDSVALAADSVSLSGKHAVATVPPGPCSSVEAIKLEATQTRQAVMVRARYGFGDAGKDSHSCGSPTWSVSPKVNFEMMRDPFLIAVPRDETVRGVIVYARSPNGVDAKLWVPLH